VFRAELSAPCVDLRKAPFVSERAVWTHPEAYAGCQRFGRIAREARVGTIRYESVRDPARGACCAVLAPGAFARRRPLEQPTWMLSASRDEVVWQRTGTLRQTEFAFAAAPWRRGGERKASARRVRR